MDRCSYATEIGQTEYDDKPTTCIDFSFAEINYNFPLWFCGFPIHPYENMPDQGRLVYSRKTNKTHLITPPCQAAAASILQTCLFNFIFWLFEKNNTNYVRTYVPLSSFVVLNRNLPAVRPPSDLICLLSENISLCLIFIHHTRWKGYY